MYLYLTIRTQELSILQEEIKMADTAPEGESIQNKDTDVDIAPTEDAGMLDGATDTTFTERLTHEIKMADAAQEELSVHNKDTDLEIEATEDVGMLDKSDSAITYTTFKERLTHDVDFRRKFILWLALCFSAGIMVSIAENIIYILHITYIACA